MPVIHIKLPPDFPDSIRLDQYIATLKNGMNRSKLKACAQELLLNGKNAKLSSKVKAGDIIDVFWEENIPENIEPEDIPLNIVYEDENVTIINKRQGMVTHPAAGNWTGTLVNALLFYWGRSAVPQLKEGRSEEILQKRRPGIVHRLDKDTSGLIITAKNRKTEEYLEDLHICTLKTPNGYHVISDKKFGADRFIDLYTTFLSNHKDNLSEDYINTIIQNVSLKENALGLVYFNRKES